MIYQTWIAPHLWQSAAVVAAFFVFWRPGVGLEGSKGALKESVVEYVDFAILTLHNPVAFGNDAESGVGSDGFSLFTLGGVHE
jgi:hypothetical protein